MLGRLRHRLTYANLMATMAVFIALGGTSYAAITITSKNVKNGTLTSADLKNNSVKSVDVTNGSLLATDFKAGQIPAGAPGAAGPQGPKGDTGERGPQGPVGAAGANGAPATKLLAAVNEACGFKRGQGALSSALAGDARCDVRFNQNIASCFAQVTVRADPSANSAELTASTAGEPGGYAGLDANEVAVLYHDSAGVTTTTERPPFYLAVLC